MLISSIIQALCDVAQFILAIVVYIKSIKDKKEK